MSEQQKRSAPDIEADLARTRLELTASVSALADQLDPRKQIAARQERLRARRDARRASSGGGPAVPMLLLAGTGVVLTVLVITWAVRRSD